MKQEAMFNKVDLPLQPRPLELSFSKRPKPLPRDIEEWLHGQECLTIDEQTQWPIECCSTSMTQLDSPLQGECPTLFKVDGDGDKLLSLEAIREDLEKHSSWDSSFLDSVALRLQKVEEKLDWYANRFICDGHPLAIERNNSESVAGGLKNITNRAFLTELCDMDLINSRKLTSELEEKKIPSLMNRVVPSGKKDEKTVDVVHFPGFSNTLTLPSKVEALSILDLVTKAQIPQQSALSKAWRKFFYSDASTALLTNSFWWIWMNCFKPDQSLQAALFDIICENFVVLLTGIDDGQKDPVFMYYPDCLCQAIYSAFCQAFPDSNKVINSDKFLDYLTNLISEWITGIKVGPGVWRRWPRFLLDPYHTTASSKGRPFSSARAPNREDVMSLSMPTTPNNLSWQQSRPGYQSQSSRVQFQQAKDDSRDSSSTGFRRLMSGTESNPRESPSRSARAQPLSRWRGSGSQENESTPTHIGPGPIFECVRFSILGRSPLLHHFMIRHNLVDLDTPPGPTISRRQVKELPRPCVGYKDLLRKSQEVSDNKYEQYKRDISKSVQESVSCQKHHIAERKQLETQNQRILSHRHEVAILAEKILSKKKAEQINP
ncbi:protein FAM227B-like [Halichondria panicea]|uniref:protein FAM227B-like n=1 Tax=Halichondria panicea TaxID=6063 RepID=UPI00312B8E1A